MPENRLYPVRYPSEWAVVRAVETAQPGAGSTVIGPFGSNLIANNYRTSGVPVVFVRDIRESSFEWKSDVYVEPSKASQLSAHTVEPGDIVATKMGLPPCIAAVYPAWMSPGIVTADIIRLRPDRRKADNRWLVRALNGHDVQTQVRTIMGGVTRPKVTLRDFRELRLPLPPLHEQRCIAEVLDTLDDAIRKTQQLIAKLKQVKQGLLYDLLTCGIDENGELRAPERNPEQFKRSPLGYIPKEWEVSTVEEEFEITSGIALGPHRHPKKNAWPYLRVANVQRDALDLSDVAKLEVMPSELSGRKLVAGDLLVVEGHANPEEIGRCAMAVEEVSGYVYQNHLFRLRCRRLSSHFALRWMNSSWVRGYWRRECATSSGLNTINKSRLRALTVLVPSMNEQARIVDSVDALTSRMTIEERVLTKLGLLRQGLMEDLLSGQVRVTPLLAEPTQ